MPLHDISLTISEAFPTWPGDPPIILKKISRIEDGDLANVTHLSAPVHMATHVDAPDHFLGNGQTVEDIPLDYLVGMVQVVELGSSKTITRKDLEGITLDPGVKRILLKTANSQDWQATEPSFREDFIALAPDGAELLVQLGYQVVGLDALSIAAFQEPVPTHKILLQAGILIIEGLNLSGIDPGTYRMYCLPLKIADSDGAPARVLLEDV